MGTLSGFVARLERYYTYDAQLDATTRVTDGIDYVTLKGLLQRADAGDAAAMLRLVQEAENKDLHLKAVLATRRMALTGLEWSIEPRSTIDPLADETLSTQLADYVGGVLGSMVTWRDGVRVRPFERALRQMSQAIGPNLAVIELVWNGNRLADLLPVPASRLRYDPRISEGLLFCTPSNTEGAPIPPDKFVVHTPEEVDGIPIINTLGQALMVVWLMKRFAVQDWSTFLEVFGQPLRIGKSGPNATTADKQAMDTALAQMGTLAYMRLPEGMDVEIKEAPSRTSDPFGPFVEWAEKQQSIAVLGQTLTTDIGDTGSRAAAEVHDQVRRAILEADATAEAATIEDQLIEPIVRMAFPMIPNPPLPLFRRDFRDPVDVDTNAAALASAQAIALPVEKSWAYDALGIDPPTLDDQGDPVNPLVKYPEAPTASPYSGPGGFGGA